MLQKLTLIGRLGNNPDMRYTNTGTAVCSLSVATDRKYKKDEQIVNETTWFKVTCWRAMAENVNKYLTKGSLVYIEGFLHKGNPYQIKEGERQGQWDYSLEVTAEVVKFLDSRKPGENQQVEPDDISF